MSFETKWRKKNIYIENKKVKTKGRGGETEAETQAHNPEAAFRFRDPELPCPLHPPQDATAKARQRTPDPVPPDPVA